MVLLWAALLVINLVSAVRDLRAAKPWPAVGSFVFAAAAVGFGWSSLRASQPAYQAGVALLVAGIVYTALRRLLERRARSAR